MVNVFSVPIFFILFRETLEASLIVSILLSFVHQTVLDNPELRRRLVRQVWLGASLGLAICIAIGGAFISVWYTAAKDLWSQSEDLWEAAFSLIAVVLITFMAMAMLKTCHLHNKWKSKMTKAVNDIEDATSSSSNQALEASFYARKRRRYALFFLPFITVIREGLEAVVFIGGVSIGQDPSSIPLAAVTGILCGFLIGFILFKGGNVIRLRYFFTFSSCLLLLISAGLFARAITFFEDYNWKTTAGAGDEEAGPGRKVSTIVWHLECCDPEMSNQGGWQLFNAFLGWDNTATIATVVGYISYWLAVIMGLVFLKYRMRRSLRNKEKSHSESSDSEDMKEKEVLKRDDVQEEKLQDVREDIAPIRT